MEPTQQDNPIEPEVVPRAAEVAEPEPEGIDGSKLLRIASMTKAMLEEARHAPLDEAGRRRLRDIYDRSMNELCEVLPPELRDELSDVFIPLDAGVPSESELRIAQAQLVGWLEGLFNGIQAALFSQQMAARAQLEQIRRPQALQPGQLDADGDYRPGVYL